MTSRVPSRRVALAERRDHDRTTRDGEAGDKRCTGRPTRGSNRPGEARRCDGDGRVPPGRRSGVRTSLLLPCPGRVAADCRESGEQHCGPSHAPERSTGRRLTRRRGASGRSSSGSRRRGPRRSGCSCARRATSAPVPSRAPPEAGPRSDGGSLARCAARRGLRWSLRRRSPGRGRSAARGRSRASREPGAARWRRT